MRTLVYKRTHNGDPDEEGVFGIHDCMGTVRARDFDAVIGVGGVGDEPRREDIAEKITWIGIGPHKSGRPDRPLVTFDHYLFFGPRGPRFRDHAPALAQHVYGRNVRTIMTFTPKEQVEVDEILAMASAAPPSSDPAGEQTTARRQSCRNQRCSNTAGPRR